MSEIALKERIDWIDSLKFLGIFAIFFGHFGEAGGLGYHFVFTYHVPLFFFISGFFALKSNSGYFKFIKYKFERILIPYFLFSIINILVITINSNISNPHDVIHLIWQAIFGIRNQLFADALWFLPCLFVVSILFETMFRICKNKYILLIISTIMFIFANKVISPSPIVKPRWFFNIDSALYYLIFYAIGAVIFRFLKDFNFKSQKVYIKVIIIICTLAAIIQAAYIYFQMENIITKIFAFSHLSLFYPVLSACIIIYLNILASKILSKIEYGNFIGKNTIILCGNETIIKLIIGNFIGMLGLKVYLNTPFITFVYTLFILIISYFTIIPFYKKCFPKIFK